MTKGAPPASPPAETRALLDRIDTGTVVGLRDRALLSVMVYSFARVSATVGMRQDYFRQGTRTVQRRGMCLATRQFASGPTRFCPGQCTVPFSDSSPPSHKSRSRRAIVRVNVSMPSLKVLVLNSLILSSVDVLSFCFAVSSTTNSATTSIMSCTVPRHAGNAVDRLMHGRRSPLAAS